MKIACNVKRTSVMSRTKHSRKGPGFDYQSRRAGNESGVACAGRSTKKRTHKLERKQAQQEIKKHGTDSD